MRYLMLVAFAAFFMPATVQATEWKKGEIIRPPFLCKTVQPIVDYGKARVEFARQLMNGYFQTKRCYRVPPGFGLTLKEHILTFRGLEAGNKPITFVIWSVEGRRENYIGMMTRPEAVRRGYVKKIGSQI